MNFVFILVIYLAFVSLGLPDTLLGSAWPVMRPELGVSLDAQGLITIIVSGATILSCLLNERFVRLLGTAKITAISGIATAAALLGYSQSSSYIWLLFFSIPLGLGAGAVDTCLNNYGALYLSARHVNWMTCCYGLGASIGPLLLSLVLMKGQTWHNGYFLIEICLFNPQKPLIFQGFTPVFHSNLICLPLFLPLRAETRAIFYSPPTTLSSSLAEVRFASLVE